MTPAALDDRLAVIARKPGARFLGRSLAQWANRRKTPRWQIVLFGMEDAVRQSRDDDLEKRAYESITEAEKTVCLAGQVVWQFS